MAQEDRPDLQKDRMRKKWIMDRVVTEVTAPVARELRTDRMARQALQVREAPQVRAA